MVAERNRIVHVVDGERVRDAVEQRVAVREPLAVTEPRGVEVGVDEPDAIGESQPVGERERHALPVSEHLLYGLFVNLWHAVALAVVVAIQLLVPQPVPFELRVCQPQRDNVTVQVALRLACKLLKLPQPQLVLHELCVTDALSELLELDDPIAVRVTNGVSDARVLFNEPFCDAVELAQHVCDKQPVAVAVGDAVIERHAHVLNVCNDLRVTVAHCLL